MFDAYLKTYFLSKNMTKKLKLKITDKFEVYKKLRFVVRSSRAPPCMVQNLYCGTSALQLHVLKMAKNDVRPSIVCNSKYTQKCDRSS